MRTKCGRSPKSWVAMSAGAEKASESEALLIKKEQNLEKQKERKG